MSERRSNFHDWSKPVAVSRPTLVLLVGLCFVVAGPVYALFGSSLVALLPLVAFSLVVVVLYRQGAAVRYEHRSRIAEEISAEIGARVEVKDLVTVARMVWGIPIDQEPKNASHTFTRDGQEVTLTMLVDARVSAVAQ